MPRLRRRQVGLPDPLRQLRNTNRQGLRRDRPLLLCQPRGEIRVPLEQLDDAGSPHLPSLCPFPPGTSRQFGSCPRHLNVRKLTLAVRLTG